MTALTLENANQIVSEAIKHARAIDAAFCVHHYEICIMC